MKAHTEPLIVDYVYEYQGYTYAHTHTMDHGQELGKTYVLYKGKLVEIDDACEELRDPNLSGYFPWAFVRGLVDINGEAIAA